ncbi:MAG: replication-associated recombination protein A, partial [candidate division Zixibacteria bacterium]|nr:replication-associated recombination protein A [candidate division Zixibacteria bacterium]
MDLFGKAPLKKNPLTPLADRLRPEVLDEFVGQRHILGEGSILRKAILEDKISSLIFWGPPGCGKT